jgi:hypothetical protein
MLKDFVLIGHDPHLGFTTELEANGLWIDLNAGIRIYYLREDTLLQSTRSLDSQLIDLKRIVYPVYSHIGTVQKFCSSITFDSSALGWQPIIFEDSNLLAPFLKDRAKSQTGASYAMAQAEFINDDIIFKRSAKGEEILPTKELRNELGTDFPQSATATLDEPVDGGRFVTGLVHHMQVIDSH